MISKSRKQLPSRQKRHLGKNKDAGYSNFMQHGMRSICVYLFALALLFNGGALHVLGVAAVAHSYDVASAAAHRANHEQHQKHSHAKQNGATIAFNQVPESDHAHNGAKCCTMCISVGNLMPAVTATAIPFRYRLVTFKVSRQHLVGHLVPLDPDIPKTVV